MERVRAMPGLRDRRAWLTMLLVLGLGSSLFHVHVPANVDLHEPYARVDLGMDEEADTHKDREHALHARSAETDGCTACRTPRRPAVQRFIAIAADPDPVGNLATVDLRDRIVSPDQRGVSPRGPPTAPALSTA